MIRSGLWFVLLIGAISQLQAGRAASLAEARELAVKTNQLILMDFMTEW
jgi:hypothetical protein